MVQRNVVPEPEGPAVWRERSVTFGSWMRVCWSGLMVCLSGFMVCLSGLSVGQSSLQGEGGFMDWSPVIDVSPWIPCCPPVSLKPSETPSETFCLA